VWEDKALPLVKSDVKTRISSVRALFREADSSSARVFVVDSAATSGEGVDLIFSLLDLIPSSDFCVVLLGEAPSFCQEALQVALRRHASRFVHLPSPDEKAIESALSAGSYFFAPGPLDSRSAFIRAAMKMVWCHWSNMRRLLDLVETSIL
jgi:hypothetical protein